PPALAREARRLTRTVVAGTDSGADVRPDAAELDDAGHPRITWAGRTVTVPVLGFHQIENAMLALAVGREAGADPVRAVPGLAAVGAFVPAFESLRGALGARLVTAPDAAALGPKLKTALKGDEIVLLKASRGVALERVLRQLT